MEEEMLLFHTPSGFHSIAIPNFPSISNHLDLLDLWLAGSLLAESLFAGGLFATHRFERKVLQ